MSRLVHPGLRSAPRSAPRLARSRRGVRQLRGPVLAIGALALLLGCASSGSAPGSGDATSRSKHLFTLQVGFDDGTRELFTVREGVEKRLERPDGSFFVSARASRDTLGLVEVAVRREHAGESWQGAVAMPPGMASPVPAPETDWGSLDWLGVRQVRPPLRSDDDVLSPVAAPPPVSP